MQAALAVAALLAAVAPGAVPVVATTMEPPVADAPPRAPATRVATTVDGALAALAALDPIGDSVPATDAPRVERARWLDPYRYHRHEATFYEDRMLDDLVCGGAAAGCDPRRAGFPGTFGPLQ